MENKIAPNLRSLAILRAMSQTDQLLTPTEIGKMLGLPKQTIHRLCATLEQEGYLIRAVGQKGLRPARRLRAMASGLLSNSRTHILRHQILTALSRDVGETVNFVVAEERGMFYQDRVETDWPFRIQLPVGTHVPFHCTASGKTFLSSLPLGQRRAMVANLSLEQRTPNTILETENLMKELRLIRKQGYALDKEEFVEGMVAIAVPLTDPGGRFFAAVAYHGPVQRLSIADAVANRDRLVEAAVQLRDAHFVD